MKYIFEIYLNKKYVTKKEWGNFINVISNYNGMLRKWKIIITNDNNKIRYFKYYKKKIYSTKCSNFCMWKI